MIANTSLLRRNITVTFSTGDGLAIGKLTTVDCRCVLLSTSINMHSIFPAPDDYTSVGVNITFTPRGEDTICINITVNEDQVIENEESFTVNLESAMTGAMLLDQSEVTILDSTGKENTFHATKAVHQFVYMHPLLVLAVCEQYVQ